MVLLACSPVMKVARAQTSLLQDTALKGAHVGICVYDPATSKYLYNYQGDHYFTPASNTKLFTCYAAMKYLGDSLVGARYVLNGKRLLVIPAGDPTFLHPDFEYQPLLKLLKENGDSINFTLPDKVIKYGPGWSWDDYEADYMPERNAFPIYGNVVWFYRQQDLVPQSLITNDAPSFAENGKDGLWIYPRAVVRGSEIFILPQDKFLFRRRLFDNSFYPETSLTPFRQAQVPFITEYGQTTIDILGSTIDKTISTILSGLPVLKPSILHSQPTDSMLRPMMHRSDNFFAEQSLLMVSNEKLGYMNDEAIIDTLLQNDLKDLPQKPVWVDGSGLSRYNLFTPQDFITLLLKMKNEFGIERIKNILPKGNTGTLTNYYQKLGSNIFAKTGSLSGAIALSGYLTCKSGKQLLFSILVNNNVSSGRFVRRAVEKFIMDVWAKN